MATDKKAIGKTFLESVLKHVPEAERADLATKLGGNDAILEALGEDRLALQADHARLTDWYNQNAGALAKAKTILATRGNAPGLDLDLDDDPEDPLGLTARRKPAAAGLDEATVLSRIQTAVAEARTQTEQQGLQLINKMTRTAISHLQEFGEVLDTDALTDFAIKQNLRLDLAYDEFVKVRRAEKTTAANAKALQEAEERGRQAGRAEAINHQVPVPPGSAGTTLSGLTTEGKVDASMPALLSAFREAQAAGA
jgi:hypothetical protein